VDLAVVEVGIGGRLDATNVVEPCASVITTIDYDHTDLFGRNLRQIAAEDAGTIRPGSPVVTVPQPPPASEVIEQTAASCGATLIRVGREVRYRTRQASREGLRVSVYGRARPYRDLWVPLLGRHQSLNAAAAVAAIEALGPVGFPISDAAIRSGLAGLRWPARIEVLGVSPTLVLDVAHNAVSFRALRATLDEVFPGERVVLVIGLLGSKDLAGIARIIGPRASVVIATRAHDDRALAAADIASAFRPVVGEVRVADDPAEAVTLALALAGPGDLICVTGSFHVAGPVMAHLGRAPAGFRQGVAAAPAVPVAAGAVDLPRVHAAGVGRVS
jgi:dihydrofolate synthase/folylpolyglutamate synthase